LKVSEAVCVAAERKLTLLAVATGIIGALALIGMELFVLYEEVLVYVPAAIVETLRVMVSRL
jgi:hypothetical protein